MTLTLERKLSHCVIEEELVFVCLFVCVVAR